MTTESTINDSQLRSERIEECNGSVLYPGEQPSFENGCQVHLGGKQSYVDRHGQPFPHFRDFTHPSYPSQRFHLVCYPPLPEGFHQSIVEYHDKQVTFYAFVKEVCPQTHKQHNHIYIETKNSIQNKTVLAWYVSLGVHPHVESCVGDRTRNLQYMSKEEPLTIVRECPPQHPLLALLPHSVSEAVQIDPSYMANHATQFIAMQNSIGRELPLPDEIHVKQIYWYFGETGTGKSLTARKQISTMIKLDPHLKWNLMPLLQGGNIWLSNYHQEELFLIEEIRGSSMALNNLLMLLDQYPCQVPVKGGFTYFNSSHIWITTPLSPRDTFVNVSTEKINQLERRINFIVEFQKLDEDWFTQNFHKGNQDSWLTVAF